MKHRFLVHSLNHTVLLVDITAIGLPAEVYPSEGKPQAVQTLRFQTWGSAKEYLRGLGTSEERLDEIGANVKGAGLGVLTII